MTAARSRDRTTMDRQRTPTHWPHVREEAGRRREDAAQTNTFKSRQPSTYNSPPPCCGGAAASGAPRRSCSLCGGAEGDDCPAVASAVTARVARRRCSDDVAQAARSGPAGPSRRPSRAAAEAYSREPMSSPSAATHRAPPPPSSPPLVAAASSQPKYAQGERDERAATTAKGSRSPRSSPYEHAAIARAQVCRSGAARDAATAATTLRGKNRP